MVLIAAEISTGTDRTETLTKNEVVFIYNEYNHIRQHYLFIKTAKNRYLLDFMYSCDCQTYWDPNIHTTPMTCRPQA